MDFDKETMEKEEQASLEITLGELEKWQPGSYTLVDIRESGSENYGIIPGALLIPEEELESRAEELKDMKNPVLYCTKGIISKEWAEKLQNQGIPAVSLAGGYMAWLMDQMKRDQAELEGNGEDGALDGQDETENSGETQKLRRRAAEERRAERQHTAEVSIRKKFHKELFTRFAKAIRDYELVQENDKIAVCISGGKDSMLMAKLFQELKHHNKFPFELVFLVMDPGYNQENRALLEHNARLLGVPVTIFETEIFDAVYNIEKSPCYLCARMRRGYLYSKAKELGCNKIALGHHYDDVIETILMGMLYGGQVQTMMPKLHSIHFEGMELIRPMYYIREEDIKRWRDYNELHFLQCACHFTETCTTCHTDGTTSSKRLEIKNMIREMKKVNPFVEGNIFRSVENVNLDTVVGYKSRGVRHSFLENYDEWADSDAIE